MIRMILLIIAHLMMIQCANAQEHCFRKTYFSLVRDKKVTFRIVSIADSLDIAYLSKGYYAERENGGSGYLIVLPKDTTYAKILNFNKFSQCEWKKRRALVLAQGKALTDGILKDNVEKHFEIYFFFFKQESLYAEGGAVDDNGVEWPDWGPKENAPLEVYKWENGEWVFQYIQQRTTETKLDFGMKKAEQILKERFGEMAAEIEDKK